MISPANSLHPAARGRAARQALVALVALTASLAACGGRPPPPVRGVIETDVGEWNFRRYQQVLDVEVWVPDNRAVAHTASYAHVEAVKRSRLDPSEVIHAFVTRYERDEGIVRAVVKLARRLAQESGYKVEERGIGGVRVLTVEGGGEMWALWAAPGHVVKIGGRLLDSIPESLVKAYGERYPSRVPTGALEGPLPPGKDLEQPADGEQPYDPDNPAPDWERYDPDAVKSPPGGADDE